MVADGESQLLVERQRLLKAEILELTKEDASVVFVEPKTKTNWTLEAAKVALKEALADPRHCAFMERLVAAIHVPDAMV